MAVKETEQTKSLCKFCLIYGTKSLTIRDAFNTEEELFDHIEMEHDLVIRRLGETEAEAKKRVYAKNKRIGTGNCQCPNCIRKRRAVESWARQSKV